MKREQSSGTLAQKPQFHGQRIDKTVQWLAESRESWKEKTKASKAELKVTTLALKRARDDRALYSRQAKEERLKARQELKKKDAEIEELKKRLEYADQKIEQLKKKR